MNIAHYREIVLPRLLSRVLPEGAARLHHGWYGDKWTMNFLFNGMPFRATIEMLDTPSDQEEEFTAADAEVPSA